MSGWALLSPLMSGGRVRPAELLVFAVLGGIAAAVGSMAVGWVKRQRRRARFRLRDDRAVAPVADLLLGAAQVLAPSWRCWRCARCSPRRRASSIALRGGRSNSRAAAPPRPARPRWRSGIRSRARDGGAARRHGAPPRRAGRCPGRRRPSRTPCARERAGTAPRRRTARRARRAGDCARPDLEAALDRRSVAEAERERLASDLCRLLGDCPQPRSPRRHHHDRRRTRTSRSPSRDARARHAGRSPAHSLSCLEGERQFRLDRSALVDEINLGWAPGRGGRAPGAESPSGAASSHSAKVGPARRALGPGSRAPVA